MKHLYDLKMWLLKAWYKWREEWYHMNVTGRGHK